MPAKDLSPCLSAFNLPLGAEFCNYLTVERRLARNTLLAYSRDLMEFAAFWGTELAARPAPLPRAGRGRTAPGGTQRQEPVTNPEPLPLTREHLNTLTPDTIRGFVAHCHAQRVARSTIQRRMGALRTWFKFLQREGVMTTNPARVVAAPKLGKPLPRAPSESQTAELLRIAATPTAHPKPNWLRLRDRALLELLYSSGLRISELCGLDRFDLDLEQGMARVTGKGSKERVVPVGEMALVAVREYLAERQRVAGGAVTGALFLGSRGERLNPRIAQRLVVELRERLDLPPGLTPHALRHACATHMLQGGADLRVIQELLGHSSLSTTQRYTSLDLMKLVKIYDAAHPRAGVRGDSS